MRTTPSLFLALIAGLSAGAPAVAPPQQKKNVLYIVSDDLRPELPFYNHSWVIAPNLQRLARTSLVFDRAYAHFAICNPSRNSFMTGRTPDTTKVWEFADSFREEGVGKDWVSLPQFFKQFGYLTLGSGKIFHPSSKRQNIRTSTG